jgi:hypothetical protein
MGDVIAAVDLDQRLTTLATSEGFRDLMCRQPLLIGRSMTRAT